jgi:hypothetical protein
MSIVSFHVAALQSPKPPPDREPVFTSGADRSRTARGAHRCVVTARRPHFPADRDTIAYSPRSKRVTRDVSDSVLMPFAVDSGGSQRAYSIGRQ